MRPSKTNSKGWGHNNRQIGETEEGRERNGKKTTSRDKEIKNEEKYEEKRTTWTNGTTCTEEKENRE